MQYVSHYFSPLGPMTLSGNETTLTGLWFDGQKHYGRTLEPGIPEGDTRVFSAARYWLDSYFSGKAPQMTIPLAPAGTAFQQEVWQLLLTIPYGKTMTYGQIARQLAANRGKTHMSAQAVGHAVSRNPISLLIPCHRVVGSGGTLTGYAGGIDKKRALLELEKADILSDICLL